MIPMNPCKGILIAKSEEAVVDPLQEDEEKVLTKEEIETFLNAAKKPLIKQLFFIITKKIVLKTHTIQNK